MDTDNEEIFVVCVDWGKEHVDSYLVACCMCDKRLAVSKYVTDQGGYPKDAKHICMTCMMDKIEEDKKKE